MLLLTATALTACSGEPGEEDTDSDESEVRVRPRGSETTLTVKLPDGWCQAGETQQGCSHWLSDRPAIRINGYTRELGVAVKVNGGRHTVSVGNVDASVYVSSGAAAKLVLAVAHRTCPETDFGGRCVTSLVPQSPLSGRGATILDQDSAFLPGKYSYEFDYSSRGIELKAKASVVDIEEQLFRTTLNFKDPRELGDARPTKITSTCSDDRGWTAPGGTLGKVKLTARVRRGCSYYLEPGAGWKQELAQRDLEIKLKRIDVDHMEVARQDGGTDILRGDYHVYSGSEEIAKNLGLPGWGSFPSNTGVDVLSGDYELVMFFPPTGAQRQKLTL